MKFLDKLHSLRANLLQLKMGFDANGRLSNFELTIGVPVAIAFALIEILRFFH